MGPAPVPRRGAIPNALWGIIDMQRAQITIAPLRRGIKLSFGVRGGYA